MATIEDASMPDAPVIETIDFSEGALEWLQANRQKLEDMVKRKQKMYNLEEWEELERWAYSQSDKLDVAKGPTANRAKRMAKDASRANTNDGKDCPLGARGNFLKRSSRLSHRHDCH